MYINEGIGYTGSVRSKSTDTIGMQTNSVEKG